MRVVIAGGHGKIALLLERALTEDGDEAVGLVRNPDHVPDVEATGAEAVVLDLETTEAEALADVLRGSDAVVFAAGAGPGSGTARKETVDKGAAVLLADAAERAGVRRYVMVSAIGTDRADPTSGDVYQVYLRAKAAADRDLRGRESLEWTIVRPGRLSDDEGTGKVDLGPDRSPASVPRSDVAAVLAELITTGRGVHQQVDLVAGRVPVAEAVASLGD